MPITRKWLSRRDWGRITERSDAEAYFSMDDFAGHAHLIKIRRITKPFIASKPFLKDPVTLADVGYEWLMLLPDGAPYAATYQFDAAGKLLQIYVDIICGSGTDALGDRYFDDIFIDVILLSDGRVIIDDEDELDEGLAKGEITKEQHASARDAALDVKEDLSSHRTRWIETGITLRNELSKRLSHM